MRSAACRMCTLLASVFVLATCTEQSTAPVSEVETVQSAINAGNCDLVPGLTNDVKTYFPEPERTTVVRYRSTLRSPRWTGVMGRASPPRRKSRPCGIGFRETISRGVRGT